MDGENFEALLRFFKALADESRLRIVGVLANRECSVDEIAIALDLQAPTVSHHLNKLKSLSLVSMRREGNVHYYRLDMESLRALTRRFLEGDKAVAIAADESGDAYERKVMRVFVPDGKIKELPASPKKRQVILNWLVEKFDRNRKYPEKELNEIIKQYHPDYATLRRYMIDAGLMDRADGVYWRT
ncbi:MAG: metalloregulator ArsR/SmtB family transcription factor [Firmicutes bacterium]|nr:metalloregulator ArsR/SmtB family transcription factor [Bacillota bacterium]